MQNRFRVSICVEERVFRNWMKKIHAVPDGFQYGLIVSGNLFFQKITDLRDGAVGTDLIGQQPLEIRSSIWNVSQSQRLGRSQRKHCVQIGGKLSIGRKTA